MSFPVPYNEAERLNELLALQPDEWGPSDALQSICEVAAWIARTPISLLSLIYSDEQCFAAHMGIAAPSNPREAAFCSNTILGSEPILVENLANDERFASNPLVIGEPGFRGYAGIPIETKPGLRLGTLCVIDYKPRTFSRRQVAMLSKLAKVATAIILSHHSSVELAGELSLKHQHEKELWEAAHQDPLTGLANLKALRVYAAKHLDEAPAGTSCALMLLDLDFFKSINDRWGHAEGDAYLCRVARQLKASVRQADLVARIGGDEFAVMLTAAAEPVIPVAEIVERVQINLRNIAQQTGKDDLGRASIGVAFAPEHGKTLEKLHQAADLALYQSKAAGRNTCTFYDSAMKNRAAKQRKVREGLRKALAAGQIVPYYQPRIDLKSGTSTGFEALARWRHQTGKLILPSQFAFAFQDNELGPALTRVMTASVAADLAAWHQNGYRPGRIAINLSQPDLIDKNFPHTFFSILGNHGISPQAIAVEVTEMVVFGKLRGILHQCLLDLRRAGVSISLDDFGTGFAALQNLKEWPIDQVKIDRAFVRDCLADTGDNAIVRAIIQIAAAFRLDVTAEGIETNAQLALLKSLNCSGGQGYFFAAPMSAAEVPAFLGRGGAVKG